MSTSFLDDMSMHPVNQSIQQTEFNKELDWIFVDPWLGELGKELTNFQPWGQFRIEWDSLDWVYLLNNLEVQDLWASTFRCTFNADVKVTLILLLLMVSPTTHYVLQAFLL